MTETERLTDELARAFGGDAWHGDSLLAILGRVTADEAARPIAGVHSIWEITLHVRAWMAKGAERVATRLPAPMPTADDWPPVPNPADEAAWAATMAALYAAQAHLLAAVGTLDDAGLHEPLGPRDAAQGTGGTYAYLLHGLAQHTAYHAGQIALLDKLLRHNP